MAANTIFLILAGLALALGTYIILKPKETFEIQKKFYSLINWHIEPISLDKEIRNTKAMGIFLVTFVIIICLYVWIK